MPPFRPFASTQIVRRMSNTPPPFACKVTKNRYFITALNYGAAALKRLLLQRRLKELHKKKFL